MGLLPPSPPCISVAKQSGHPPFLLLLLNLQIGGGHWATKSPPRPAPPWKRNSEVMSQCHDVTVSNNGSVPYQKTFLIHFKRRSKSVFTLMNRYVQKTHISLLADLSRSLVFLGISVNLTSGLLPWFSGAVINQHEERKLGNTDCLILLLLFTMSIND